MDQLANILDGYIEKKRQKFTALSEEIWRYAEVGFQEFRSAQALEGGSRYSDGFYSKIWQRKTGDRLFGRIRCAV